MATGRRTAFGTVPGQGMAERITLSNAAGMRVDLLSLGAAIHAVHVPDRDGVLANVTLGHASVEGYLAQPGYLGASVGRVANRIAGGRFRLDGTSYQLPCNNGANSLHGGTTGFDKRLWDVVEASASHAVLRLVSPDGDQGYPGTLTVTATCRLDEDNRLAVTYSAATDAATIVNLTNHAYWNLAGEGSGSALGHRLMIAADAVLPTDSGLIPTGEIRPVVGTPFDFREAAIIADRIGAGDEQLRLAGGFDHNMVLSRPLASEPRLAARLEDPASGRRLELFTDQPGLQFYSGNFLDGGIIGTSGLAYGRGDGITLEPQMFPDTPNQPVFGSIRLDPGQVYRNRMIFAFSAG